MRRVGLFLDRSISCVRDMLDGIAMFLDQLPANKRWECWYHYDLETNEQRPIRIDGAFAMVDTRVAAMAAMQQAPVVIGVLGSPMLGFPYPTVTVDDMAIGRVAASELLRRGHRDLAFVSNVDSDRLDHVQLRREGFAEEAGKAGAQLHLGPGTGTLRQFLVALPRPCGLLAMTDETARFVLDSCRAVGIRVPQEIAVIGVDNDPQTCELSWPPLATVQPGHFEVGYRAASRLNALMNGDPDLVDQPIEVIGVPEIIVRASVDARAVQDEFVAQALQFIALHAQEDVSVEDICNATDTGRRSLEMRFKRAIGHSILEELRWSRIQISRRLLRNRRLSMNQIARLSGFGTQTHFGVIFRRMVGMTPTAYRRQVAPLPFASR